MQYKVSSKSFSLNSRLAFTALSKVLLLFLSHSGGCHFGNCQYQAPTLHICLSNTAPYTWSLCRKFMANFYGRPCVCQSNWESNSECCASASLSPDAQTLFNWFDLLQVLAPRVGKSVCVAEWRQAALHASGKSRAPLSRLDNAIGVLSKWPVSIA